MLQLFFRSNLLVFVPLLFILLQAQDYLAAAGSLYNLVLLVTDIPCEVTGQTGLN